MLILMGNVQGTMSSLASPVSLGSLMGVSYSGRSHSVVRRVSLSRGNCRGRKRWHCVPLSVCRYSVTTTDFVADQGNSVSLDSNSSSTSSKGGDDGAGFVLKPSPKPVLKSPENKSDPILGPSRTIGDPVDVEERNKVIESLGEVLEKAEKLGSFKVNGERNNGSVNKPVRSNADASPKADKLVNSAASQKFKTLKSVWLKGDTVASVQKVVKEVPNLIVTRLKGRILNQGEGRRWYLKLVLLNRL